MRRFFPILLSLVCFASCFLKQRTPKKRMFTGGEGYLYWSCMDYEYDSLGRLFKVTDHSEWPGYSILSYDADGNVTESASYDSSGRLTDKMLYSYDAEGNEPLVRFVWYVDYKDSFSLEKEFIPLRYPVSKARPDTSAPVYSCRKWFGKNKLDKKALREREFLMGFGSSFGTCMFYLCDDTLLIETGGEDPRNHPNCLDGTLEILYDYLYRPDRVILTDSTHYTRSTYKMHYDAGGRISAITERACDDICQPSTKYFFFNPEGRVVEVREAYGSDSPECPKNAQVERKLKYENGKRVESCSYLFHSGS